MCGFFLTSSGRQKLIDAAKAPPVRTLRDVAVADTGLCDAAKWSGDVCVWVVWAPAGVLVPNRHVQDLADWLQSNAQSCGIVMLVSLGVQVRHWTVVWFTAPVPDTVVKRVLCTLCALPTLVVVAVAHRHCRLRGTTCRY